MFANHEDGTGKNAATRTFTQIRMKIFILVVFCFVLLSCSSPGPKSSVISELDEMLAYLEEIGLQLDTCTFSVSWAEELMTKLGKDGNLINDNDWKWELVVALQLIDEECATLGKTSGVPTVFEGANQYWIQSNFGYSEIVRIMQENIIIKFNSEGVKESYIHMANAVDLMKKARIELENSSATYIKKYKEKHP